MFHLEKNGTPVINFYWKYKHSEECHHVKQEDERVKESQSRQWACQWEGRWADILESRLLLRVFYLGILQNSRIIL